MHPKTWNKKQKIQYRGPHYYHCIIVFTRNHCIANTLQGFHVTNINLEEYQTYCHLYVSFYVCKVLNNLDQIHEYFADWNHRFYYGL